MVFVELVAKEVRASLDLNLVFYLKTAFLHGEVNHIIIIKENHLKRLIHNVLGGSVRY